MCYRKCSNIKEVIIPQTIHQICIHASFVVCLLLLRLASTEHGQSGVQLSIGADIEAYGDQAGAASNRFSTSLKKKPAELYNCQGPTKLLVSSTFLIFRLSAWTHAMA